MTKNTCSEGNATLNKTEIVLPPPLDLGVSVLRGNDEGMTDSKRAIVIYARTSTGEDLERQVEQCRRFAAEHGLGSVARVEADQCGGGARSSQPQLAALVETAKKGVVSALLCATPDRLSRSCSAVAETIATLEETGIGVVSTRE